MVVLGGVRFLMSEVTLQVTLWGLLRIPARGDSDAPKGYTAIGRREEYISQLDGQTLMARFITLLDSMDNLPVRIHLNIEIIGVDRPCAMGV